MKFPTSQQLDLFVGASHEHASLLVLPGSEKARKMTVTSGMKCFELLPKSNLLLSLVKMFLESSIWRSTRCYLTWRVKVTKQQRLLFQLAPSTPRTEGTGRGLLPSPKETEIDASKTSKGIHGFNRIASDGREWGNNLGTLIPMMLPTPTTQETEHPEAILTETGRRKTIDGTSSHSMGLADKISLLKTPSATECEGGIMEIREGVNAHYKLRDQIAMLPTPRAMEGASHKKTIGGKSLTTEAGTNLGLKLHGDFVCWMQGFPIDWLDIP